MNCPECQELLQRRLDGEILANSPELERHLSECLACREQHQAASRLLEALRSARPVLEGTPAPRIVMAVLRDRRGPQHRRWTGLALGGSLLLMALAGYLWWPPG